MNLKERLRKKIKKKDNSAEERRIKELEKRTLSAFIIPKPKWHDAKFVTTAKFLHCFNQYNCSDKGYIQSRDLENFTCAIFDDVKKEEVNIEELKRYIHGYMFFFQIKKQRWISMFDLYDTLEEVLLPNFFLNLRGRLKYSSVDVMQIWRQYNPDDTMTLDTDEFQVFVFDLFLTSNQKCNYLLTKAMQTKLLELANEKELTLRGLSNILPLETSILDQYPDLQVLTKKDAKRIFSFYDQDDEGSIDGCELYALIKDVLEKNGSADPYNINTIHDGIDYLRHEGAITQNGALDQSCYKMLFKLGLNQTTL